MKTTHLAFIIAATCAAYTYGGDAKVTLDSANGASAFIVRDSASNEIARVSSDGKVGIGTNAPAATLDVHGASGSTLKLVDGNQAAGKVLTSDASGNASWQTAANGTPVGTGGNANYMKLGMSASQSSVTYYTTINFNTVRASNGITNSGNGINLKAGVTYRLEAAVNISDNIDIYQFFGYSFHNGNVLFGQAAYTIQASSSAPQSFKAALLEFYTPATDVTVTVKATDAGPTFDGVVASAYNTYFIATEMTSSSGGSGSGAVTSVSATGPLASSGGATPTLTIQTASDSQAGALSANDWTTFNSKVGGSGTANYVPAFTASGTLGDSVLYSAANGNVGIGTATPNNKLQIGSTLYSVNSLAMGNGTQNFAIDISARTIPTFFSDNNFSFMASGGGNGNVGIGTTTPDAPLTIANSGGVGLKINNGGDISITAQVSGGNAVLYNDTGNLQVSASAGSGAFCDGHTWVSVSDARLKRDIQPMTRYGINSVMQLKPVTYYFKDDVTSHPEVGFIAQDMQDIVPEVVHGTEGDISKGETLGLSYGNLVPVLAKAIQELKAENDALKARLEALEAKIK